MYNQLLAKWNERLERFKSITEVAKNLDPRLSLDVSSAKIEAYSECIKDLEEYQEALSIEISAALKEIRSHIPEDSLYNYKYIQTIIS